MTYLIQSTDKIRVGTVEEAEKLQKDLKNDNSFELKSFSYVKKEIKEKGEIIEEYVLCTATKIFNVEKYPEQTVNVIYETERESWD